MSLVLIMVVLLTLYGNRSNPEQNFQNGEYVGEAFLHVVLAKIKNDSVYIDWIYLQKEPRDFVSDTNVVDKRSFPFHGKFCNIYKKKSKIYVKTNQPWHSEGVVEAKLKIDSKTYEKVNKYKNVAYLYKGELKMKSEYSDRSMFEIHNMYLKKHELANKALKLKHKEFIGEFMKFKAELSKAF